MSGAFLKRTVTTFCFWALLGGFGAVLYSEMVTHVYTVADGDEEEPDLEERRLEPYQMFAFALTAGSSAVTARILMDLLARQSVEAPTLASPESVPAQPVVMDRPLPPASMSIPVAK